MATAKLLFCKDLVSPLRSCLQAPTSGCNSALNISLDYRTNIKLTKNSHKMKPSFTSYVFLRQSKTGSIHLPFTTIFNKDSKLPTPLLSPLPSWNNPNSSRGAALPKQAVLRHHSNARGAQRNPFERDVQALAEESIG
jgi:hypothetical protein